MKELFKQRKLIFLNTMIGLTLLSCLTFAMLLKFRPSVSLYGSNSDIIKYLFIIIGMCIGGFILEILAIYGLNASFGKHGFKISQGVDNEKDNEPKKSS